MRTKAPSGISDAHTVPTDDNVQTQKDHAKPNGGLVAWLQVAASFLLYFNVLGLLNTYGQFQTLYEQTVLSQETPSRISWIGSTQYLLCYLTCILGGRLCDNGHHVLLLLVGTLTMVFGLAMVSICRVYYQFFLSQAVVTGVGFGLVFMPATSIVPQWFAPNRSPLAFGIATTGSSIGAVVYPITLQRLSQEVGFGWAVRSIALMVLVTQAVACAFFKRRSISKGNEKVARSSSSLTRRAASTGLVMDAPYLFYCIALFVGFMGLYVFYYYINLYAVEVTNTPTSTAFYLLAILNGGSFFGRLIPNAITPRLGPLNVQLFFGLLTGILAFTMLTVKSTAGIIAFAVAYGFVSAPVITMPALVILSLTPDKSVAGVRSGVGFACMGLGVLIGGPAAGAILGTSERLGGQNWSGMVIWCGAMLLASIGIGIYARWRQVGSKCLVKV